MNLTSGVLSQKPREFYEPGGNTCSPQCEPVIRERIENTINSLVRSLGHTQEIEAKIFNPIPTNGCNGEKPQSTVESLLYQLNQIAIDIEENLARVNSKL